MTLPDVELAQQRLRHAWSGDALERWILVCEHIADHASIYASLLSQPASAGTEQWRQLAATTKRLYEEARRRGHNRDVLSRIAAAAQAIDDTLAPTSSDQTAS